MNIHNPPDGRTVLRQAIVERDAAAGREREAAASLDRADRTAARAKIRLNQLGGVDEEILAHATAQYREFAQSGGDAPTIDVPSHLAAKREQRDAARAELDAAKAAVAQLAGEHAAAQTERAKLDQAVAQAADVVVAAEALPAIGRYLAAIKQARQSWNDAQAIVGMIVPKPPAFALEKRMSHPALPEGVREVLGRGFGAEIGPRESSPPAAARWTSLRERLRQDADAELE